MAKQGMNADQIESDGTQMKDVGANGIPGVIAAIDGIVGQLRGTWWGPDAEQFESAWTSTHKPNLTTIAGNVATQGETALTNVRIQRETSAAGSTV